MKRVHVEKWNDETQRYEPITDAFEAFQASLKCKYPITDDSHPVRLPRSAAGAGGKEGG